MDDKPKVLVNLGWPHIPDSLNQRSSEVFFKSEEKISDGDLFDGLLYLPVADFKEEEVFQDEVKKFERLVALLNGLEGKYLFIWVDCGDSVVEEEAVKEFRLEERGCEWRWDFQATGDVSKSTENKIIKYFEEHLQTSIVKPAKKY